MKVGRGVGKVGDEVMLLFLGTTACVWLELQGSGGILVFTRYNYVVV